MKIWQFINQRDRASQLPGRECSDDYQTPITSNKVQYDKLRLKALMKWQLHSYRCHHSLGLVGTLTE